ncbi:major facilitator superfamily domain-containing protein [Lipomyces doorenjongii]|uniref:major facilitator superfamily domain-containing protein n=1 Tax=Lipomyces doorenjongii TaxID=383834 RepID=UPI0034CF7D1A
MSESSVTGASRRTSRASVASTVVDPRNVAAMDDGELKSVDSTLRETTGQLRPGTATAPPLTRARSRRSVNAPPPPAMRRANTASAIVRRPSVTPTVNSFRSMGMSQKEIYGDTPADLIQLERIRTMETVASLYRSITRDEGEMSAPNDAQELADIDPELVTWDGPEDAENPRNWVRSKKWRATIAISVYTFLGPFSSSILSPAVPKICESFGVTNTTLAALMVSIFVLAWAIVPLVVAPMSEIFGRRVVLHISIFILLVFNMACGLSKDLTQILVFRFLAGAGGAGPLAIGAGVVADIWNDDERTAAIGLFSIGPTAGPILAPIISGWIAMYLPWQWVFWILIIVNGTVFAFGLVTLEETYAPVLLQWKAQQLRKETENRALHTVFEITNFSAMEKLQIAITRPIILLFTNPIVFGLSMYMAFTYGFLYLLLVTFPSLWEVDYHFSLGLSGLMYLGPGLGFGLGILTVTPASQRAYHKLVEQNGGVAKPEFRLPVLAIGAVCMPVGLIWYGWSAEKQVFWIMPLIGAALFGVALISVFQCIQSYLIDMNPSYAASSTAAGTTFRSLFGFAMPLFASPMYNKLGRGWGNTMLGIVALVIGTVFPLVVYFRGERIRKWSDKRMDARRAREQAKREERITRRLEMEERVQVEKVGKDVGMVEKRRRSSVVQTQVGQEQVGQRQFEEIPEESDDGSSIKSRMS